MKRRTCRCQTKKCQARSKRRSRCSREDSIVDPTPEGTKSAVLVDGSPGRPKSTRIFEDAGNTAGTWMLTFFMLYNMNKYIDIYIYTVIFINLSIYLLISIAHISSRKTEISNAEIHPASLNTELNPSPTAPSPEMVFPTGMGTWTSIATSLMWDPRKFTVKWSTNHIQWRHFDLFWSTKHADATESLSN